MCDALESIVVHISYETYGASFRRKVDLGFKSKDLVLQDKLHSSALHLALV